MRAACVICDVRDLACKAEILWEGSGMTKGLHLSLLSIFSALDEADRRRCLQKLER